MALRLLRPCAAAAWRPLLARGLASAPAGSATAAIHADALLDDVAQLSTDADVAPPLSLSTTFTCGAPHVYSRSSNPGRARAEALLGAIESTETCTVHAILYSSGLAASFGALAGLLPKRVAVAGGYHGTHQVLGMMQRISGGASCATIPLPPPSEEALKVLQPGDVLWLETPRNPDCEVMDIGAYVRLAKQVGDVKVIVDGTFAPPPLQRPLALGADVVMHSTTKSLSGHSDAIGGALCVADECLAEQLRADRGALGSVPGSLEVWLLQRSLRTLHLRVRQQSETAATLAAWLQVSAV